MEHLTWQPVKNYEGLYEITEAEQVRSLQKRNYHNILSQRIDRAGYYTVRLSKKGVSSTEYVHRLLAETFIPNPLNKPEVNHKDLNKLNNSLENLEWVTHSENMLHAYKNGAIKCRRGKGHPSSIPVLFKPTGEEFYSIREAAKNNGRNYESFRRCLRTNKNNGFIRLDRQQD